MNGTQLKCFLVILILFFIGFGPLSLTCLIGIGIVIWRPAWFYRVVRELYRGHGESSLEREPTNFETAAARIKCLLSLLLLLLLDIAPVPVTGTLALCVVIARPFWFKRLVETIYHGGSD
ncbi:hypothetical protein [Methylococcus sp. EFPC2]|uniref:hypothetical protein n=1 Tax=Methylococcus sp. EFPC2 TaxID=2812648 RepID=UPI0019676F62|nr:hypothetical protein [Methylococcus sp. EFPC2]QSA99205.1 hypothetical protein JWZ97_13220 [Methylococcus sp. EFPC2]